MFVNEVTSSTGMLITTTANIYCVLTVFDTLF